MPRTALRNHCVVALGLALCGSLLPPAPACAQAAADHALYRCRGSDGVTSYQQTPCGDGQLDAGRILYQPVEERSAPPVSPPADGSGSASPPEAAPAATDDPVPSAPAPAPAAQPVFSGTARVSEPASDAVECLRPDSTTYVRSRECERSTVGGEKVEGYVIDEETGQRVWMETVATQRQIQDPARALTRMEACELARMHIAQIRAGKAEGGVYLRDAEQVRDRHCD